MRMRVLIAAIALTLAAPAGAAADGRYVAIGDSLTGPADSYVVRLAEREGITDVQTIASSSRAVDRGPEVRRAVALIADPADTRLVTVGVGGNDFLWGNCVGGWNDPTCDYADGLQAILSPLRRALDGDPGAERLLVLGYYNPASGAGDDRERTLDLGLRGADGRIDSAAHGGDWGMTDVIGWLACRNGATLADAWPAFKAGGRALIGSDGIHPTSAGQAALADVFSDPASGGPTPPCPPTVAFATTGPDERDGRVHGIVEPRLAPARWWFEWGATADYGHTTPPQELAPSAGPRAVAADLPAAAGVYHVRLVTENAVGRSAGADQQVEVRPPTLEAGLHGRHTRAGVLRRGVALRIASDGTSVDLHGVLRRRGRDVTAFETSVRWTPGRLRTLRVPLSRGRRLLRTAAGARLVVALTARRGMAASAPIRLRVDLRR